MHEEIAGRENTGRRDGTSLAYMFWVQNVFNNNILRILKLFLYKI